MKKFSIAIMTASAFALAACNPAEDEAGDVVAEETEDQVEMLEDAADNATTEQAEEAYEDAAEKVEDHGEHLEEVAEGDAAQ
ncbi:hypothetical protein [Sphingomicrobium lutaoense]|uniref:Protein involved in sex pheromone biosynthesis n=1 Tax=Sphingomicrobium lutaoense TaxID=515949 RepID=A0A839Z0B6_9SPHN|nr:hypothetical protein [Sphingomicrobium lutaoense]MBB3764130.1 protein involved in sex pheromone biosynthesis [Sphingomicrobium lutaoense]